MGSSKKMDLTIHFLPSAGRNNTGRYTVLLTNPFSSDMHHRNIIVLYGPDMPVLKVSPTKAVFVSGESLFLSSQAEGGPPSATWFFNGESIATSSTGTVNLTKSPSGEPQCSVQAVNGGAALQFLCLWPGSAPEAQESFPSLSVNASGYGNYSMTLNDIQRLNGSVKLNIRHNAVSFPVVLWIFSQ
ncbi:V-set and immunoglobulin domain-containing protein 10-like [Sinocyclocheilus anshuiensis]|uniref:V-set and immunoglobulin domain-containing protein 10-like n=1 Tax=Sinocyclocheilus anshuiensis TaxID=1608454 RepID=UPI0007B8AB68|nr:PREDICTED: V-set and immunoglobulin domain-containing protein 10-like [Sinocyclocheilus anshuiensis]